MAVKSNDLDQMKNKVVAVFGGTGFMGQVVIRKLLEAGAKVKLSIRRLQAKRTLQDFMINSEHLTTHQFSLDDYPSISSICKGTDFVINLIGIFHEKNHQTFQNVHVKGILNIALAAKEAKVKRLVHISALGAEENSSSQYLASKAQAERKLESFPNVTILRPCVVYGETDNFINNIIDMVQNAPFFFLLGKKEAKFQPVYVGDVADAVIKVILLPKLNGKVYELGGDQIFTMRQMIEIISIMVRRKRSFVHMPLFLANILIYFLEFSKKPPFTRELLKVVQKNALVSPNALNLKDLKIAPKKFEDILLQYQQIKKLNLSLD